MSTNSLIKYESGAGFVGVSTVPNVVGQDSGKLVVGWDFPENWSYVMYGVACDWSENVFFSDADTNTIYRANEGGVPGTRVAGIIQPIAGPGEVGTDLAGFVNGLGSAARFDTPKGIACDKSGNIYVADSGNNRIRKVSQRKASGVGNYADPTQAVVKGGGAYYVTTIAGGFNNPCDVACAPNGDIIVADTNNHKIYRVTPSGQKFLVAGSTVGDVSGTVGGVRIVGSAAKFNTPWSVTVDYSGNIYVADQGNYKIKKISPDGWVTTFAGTGMANCHNGPALLASFAFPLYLKVDRTGSLFLIDVVKADGKNRIRRIADGKVSTEAYINGTSAWGTGKNAVGIATSPAGKLFVVVTEQSRLPESSSSSSSSSENSSSSSTGKSTSSSLNSSSSSVNSSSSSQSSSTPSSQSVSSHSSQSLPPQ